MNKREMSDYGTIWERKESTTDFSEPNTEPKRSHGLGFFLLSVIVLLGVGATFFYMAGFGVGLFVHCEADEYIVVQSISGDVTVIDEVGVHFKGLSTYWVYPRRIDMRFGPTSATFNDGRMRGINTYVLVQLPKNNVDRMELHIFMTGDQANIRRLTESAVINALKLTAPTMSSVDVIAAYKHTFTELVEGQLRQGLYKYRQIETDDGFKTEVIRDENDMPVVGAKPVFAQYFLDIIQFSIVSMQTPAEEIKAMRMENIARNMVLKAQLEREHAVAEAEMVEAKLDAEMMKEVFKKQMEREAEMARMLKEAKEEVAKEQIPEN